LGPGAGYLEIARAQVARRVVDESIQPSVENVFGEIDVTVRIVDSGGFVRERSHRWMNHRVGFAERVAFPYAARRFLFT
jgi:hypothetical protein